MRMLGSTTSRNSRINRLAIVRRLAEHSHRLVEAKAAIGTDRISVESISSMMTDSIQRALAHGAAARPRRSKGTQPLVEKAS
jgi:hypothetical protein